MFDLNALISNVIADHPGVGPDELLLPVLDSIDAEDYREALSQTLREPIRHALGRQSREVITQLSTPVPLTKSGRPRALTATGKVPGVGTALLAGVGQRLGGQLLTPILVRGKAVQTGDLTVEDLEWLAQDRSNRAVSLTEMSAKFTRIKTMLTEQHVERVRDLPDEILEDLLP
jgi:hypothetical protein